MLVIIVWICWEMQILWYLVWLYYILLSWSSTRGGNVKFSKHLWSEQGRWGMYDEWLRISCLACWLVPLALRAFGQGLTCVCTPAPWWSRFVCQTPLRRAFWRSEVRSIYCSTTTFFFALAPYCTWFICVSLFCNAEYYIHTCISLSTSTLIVCFTSLLCVYRPYSEALEDALVRSSGLYSLQFQEGEGSYFCKQ